MQTPKKMWQQGKSKNKKNNPLYIKVRIEVDKERYDFISIDGIEYLYDKFDKILLPHRETMDFLTSNMKGAPIYWIRPKNDDVLSYIDKRIPKM